VPITLPLPATVNCSIVLAGLPLLDRPAAAAAAGFDAVEFWWPFDRPVPADREIEEFVTAVSDAGVTLTGLNFAAGDMAAGERGILSDPRRTGEFADNVAVAVGIGERLGTTGFNALYGNRIDGVAVQEQDELAAGNLALAGRAAGSARWRWWSRSAGSTPTRCGPPRTPSPSWTGWARTTCGCCSTCSIWR